MNKVGFAEAGGLSRRSSTNWATKFSRFRPSMASESTRCWTLSPRIFLLAKSPSRRAVSEYRDHWPAERGQVDAAQSAGGAERSIVSPEPGTTRDAVDTVVEHHGKSYRFLDTAGIRRKGKTKLIAEKLSVIMARRHLERADVAILVADASVGVTSHDATIASYADSPGAP